MSLATTDTSINQSALYAVVLGLLRFPPPGQTFPGRDGKAMRYAIDSRGSIGNVPLRRLIVQELLILTCSAGGVEAIAGVSKSGVPWAAIVADRLSLPMSVVLLDGARKSGLKRQVEGDVAGKRVLVLDNFTRTGDSLTRAGDILEAAGAEVTGFLTVVAAVPPPFSKPLYAVWSLGDLLRAAVKHRLVTDADSHLILLEEKL